MRIIRPALILIIPLLALACGSDSMTGANGTTTVFLKDSPFSEAQAVLVSFSDVSVHMSGGDFVSLPFAGGASSRTCDLKKLMGSQDVLGTAPLTAGHYTQIRLVVSGATIYFDAPSSGAACAPSITAPSGRSAPVEVPSGDVRLNREFDVTTSALAITLDFDGNGSIHETGNGKFMMNPVVSVVSVQ